MSMVSDADTQVLLPAGREKAVAIAAALRRAARQSRVPVMSISGGGVFRARKSDRLFWGCMIASFVLIVLIPSVIASVYYGIIATDQYVSEAKLALRTGDSTLMDSLSGLAGLPSSQQYQDTQIIVNYIGSRAMVEKIDEQLNLRRVYSRPDADWWARFNPTKKMEDLEKYWRKRVDAGLDQQSSIVAVEVRAFTPEDAVALTAKIIENSEELVNRFSERARSDALRDAKADLDRAEVRLMETTIAMRDDRNKLGLLSGEATALMVEKVTSALRIELTRKQQDLAVISRSARSDSPQVRILNRQIDNINSQIASYMSQIAGANGDGSATLADRMQLLSRRQSDMEIAQKLYASATINYETSRIDADTKHGYLLSFMKPTLPQKALYPRRWLYWSLIVIPAILIFAIFAGLGVLVRDHMAS